MKRVIYFIYIFICFFAFKLISYADIGDGINNGDKNYVTYPSKYFTFNGFSSYSSGYYGYYYKVDKHKNYGQKEYVGTDDESKVKAFCIDPGLKSPEDREYYYFRELDLTSILDQDLYKAYLFYVNEYTYKKNNSDFNYNSLWSNTDVLLRVLLKENDCITLTGSATRDNQFFGKDGITDYVQGNTTFENIDWSLGGNKESEEDNYRYWTKGNKEHAESVFKSAKDFYSDFKSKSDLNWVNPLDITTDIEYAEEEDAYYFYFKIKFIDDDGNNFFNRADFDNGFGQSAYFKASFDNKISDSNDYTLARKTLTYSDSTNITSSTEHTDFYDGENLTLFVKMKKSMYDEILAKFGSVYIKLNYEYYHPLSSENVFVSSFKDTKNETSSRQRMIVFDNFIHKDTLILSSSVPGEGGPTEDIINYSFCKQYNDNFYYDVDYDGVDDEITIKDYKQICGCPNIDDSVLEKEENIDFYKSECLINTQEDYSSSLYTCESESPTMGQNRVTHNYVRLINDTNYYCSLNCTEDILIEDFADEYSVFAGRNFSFEKYPSLNSSKKCEVKVLYNNWETAFIKLVNDELAIVNAASRDNGIDNATSPSGTETECWVYGEGLRSADIYNYSYEEYYYNGEEIRTKHISGSYTDSPCGFGKPTTKSYSEYYPQIADKISKIEDHLEFLRSCNQYLNNLAENYYKFSSELRFYYQQEYGKSEYGEKWNNQKINGPDDSLFKKNPKDDDVYSDGYLEVGETTYNSSDYISDSYTYPYISVGTSSFSTKIEGKKVGVAQTGDYSITREKLYSENYEPSVNKYIDPYTATIFDADTISDISESGYYKLGSVYDIDVSAVEKEENPNYYVFTKLGDNEEISKHLELSANSYTNYSGTSVSGGRDSLDNIVGLKRVCTYEIKNEIFTFGDEPSMNIAFRIVDPYDIDPNERLLEEYYLDEESGEINYKDESTKTTYGFKNWRNVKGEVVKNTLEESDIFHPDNLEYSFTLDGTSIREIRNYNNGCDDTGYCDADNRITYSDVSDNYSQLTCNDVGNECISGFITEFFGDSVNAIIDGRDNWKYLDYNNEDGYFINVFKKDKADFESLLNNLKDKGVEVTP